MAKTTFTYRDLDADFSPLPVSGDLGTKTDERAIRTAVKHLVLTNYYERLFHPEIGSPVRQLLFENIGQNFEIILSQAISDVIENYEPRVVLLEVNVKPSIDNNAVYVDIIFRIKNTDRVLDVGVTLERTR